MLLLPRVMCCWVLSLRLSRLVEWFQATRNGRDHRRLLERRAFSLLAIRSDMTPVTLANFFFSPVLFSSLFTQPNVSLRHLDVVVMNDDHPEICSLLRAQREREREREGPTGECEEARSQQMSPIWASR